MALLGQCLGASWGDRDAVWGVEGLALEGGSWKAQGWFTSKDQNRSGVERNPRVFGTGLSELPNGKARQPRRWRGPAQKSDCSRGQRHPPLPVQPHASFPGLRLERTGWVLFFLGGGSFLFVPIGISGLGVSPASKVEGGKENPGACWPVSPRGPQSPASLPSSLHFSSVSSTCFTYNVQSFCLSLEGG